VEKKKKILFCSAFTPPVRSGSGNNAYRFADYLSRQGYRVTLLSVNRRLKMPRKEKKGTLLVRRIAYFNLNLVTKLFSLAFLLFPAYLLQVLKNEVIYVYGGNLIGWELLLLLGKMTGKEVFFRSTLYGFDDAVSLTRRGFERRVRLHALNSVDRYLSMNNAFTDAWTRTFGNVRRLVRSVHGVDTGLFTPPSGKEEKKKIRRQLGLPDDRFLILSAGYLIRRKGFDEVFRALDPLPIPFLYVIAGDTSFPHDHHLAPLQDEMKELLQKGKTLLGNRIRFLGPVENMEDLYRAADLFVLFSTQEGFPPNSIMEALSSGLPVITRDIPGAVTGTTLDEVIFREKNGEALQKRILELYHHPRLLEERGRKAREIAVEEASYASVWKKLNPPKLLYFIQLPPPVHGVSMLNRTIFNSTVINEGWEKHLVRIDLSKKFRDIRRVSLQKLVKMAGLSFRLWREVRKKKPDLIYFSFMPVGKGFLRDAWFLWLMAPRRHRVLLHLNNRGIGRFIRRPLYRRLYRRVFHHTEVIHVSERLLQQEILDHGLIPRRTYVTGNTVAHLSLPPPTPGADSVPKLLFLSNYLEGKGLDILLEALKILRDRDHPFRLETYGAIHDEKLFREYGEKVTAYGLEKQVRLHGPADEGTKRLLFSRSDIFVFPSHFREECFPLVVLEAMQAGRAIVATTIGALPEMLTHGREALLVPPGDPTSLAAAIERLLTTPALRKELGHNAAERFRREFALPIFEKKMRAIFSVTLD